MRDRKCRVDKDASLEMSLATARRRHESWGTESAEKSDGIVRMNR